MLRTWGRRLVEERLERIRPNFEALIDSKRAPGFQLAVARRGKLAFIDRMGWMDVEEKIPVGEDSIFRLYSMTKPIATAALMILYEEGKIGLEEPVWRYIPAFKDLKVYVGQEGGRPFLEPLRRAITILDLTLHCAGWATDCPTTRRSRNCTAGRASSAKARGS